MKHHLSRRLLTGLSGVLLGTLGASVSVAGPPLPVTEWPGLWGPHRNASVASAQELPADPTLQILWRRPVGKGYSEVVARGQRAFLLATDGEQDFLAALDLADGNEVWRRIIGPTYQGHDGSDDGPIATPTLGDGKIFVATPFGILLALKESSGEELWRVDLTKAFGGRQAFYGYGNSPLLAGGQLILQTGAKEGNQLVALDPADGKVRWEVHPVGGTGYSSPVEVPLGDSSQIVAATTEKTFGVDGKTGKALWSVASPGEPRQSPVALPGNRLFLTTHGESMVVQLQEGADGWTAEEVWRLPVLKATYSPTVFHDGFLYGMNRTYLVCVEAGTGEVRWREKVYNGNLVKVGDVLALMGERSGTFRLVAAEPTAYRELLQEQVTQPGPQTVTGMSVMGHRFLIRNSEELIFVEIAGAQGGAGAGPEKRAEGEEEG